MVCSGDRVGVEAFGGEWIWVIVLAMAMEIMGFQEWIYPSIGQEYYGSGEKLHDSLA